MFNYDKGTRDWGKKWPICAEGQEQSPIDLPTDALLYSKAEKYQLNGYGYENKELLEVLGDSMYFAVKYDLGEFRLTLDDESILAFEPIEFHFHSPSEHTVNGKHYDLELHFMHKYKGSEMQIGALISIFFDTEDYDPQAALKTNAKGVKRTVVKNEFLDSVRVQDATKDGIINPETILVKEFLSEIDMRKYWAYKGSLSIPPCFENIHHIVIESVQPITKA